jgi:hypothetical protein
MSSPTTDDDPPTPAPTEEVWATHKYLPLVPKLFEKLRDAVGGTSTCCTTPTTA